MHRLPCRLVVLDPGRHALAKPSHHVGGLVSLGQHTLPIAEVNLWLGRARSGEPLVTGLHADAQPNLLLMLRGRKRALLVPPVA